MLRARARDTRVLRIDVARVMSNVIEMLDLARENHFHFIELLIVEVM
jgi:hypothetical protein